MFLTKKLLTMSVKVEKYINAQQNFITRSLVIPENVLDMASSIET